MEGVGRMAYSDLDDVDYLVEDNVIDDFVYHRKWMRPMVGPLLKMILISNY